LHEKHGIELNPLSLLREATRAVPAVRYATGLVGIAAAIFFIRGLLPDVSLAAMLPLLLGTLACMTALVLVSAAVTAPTAGQSTVALVFLWATCLFIITFMFFTVTAVGFGWPTSWAKLMLPASAFDTPLVETSEKRLERGAPGSPTQMDAAAPLANVAPTAEAKNEGGSGQASSRRATAPSESRSDRPTIQRGNSTPPPEVSGVPHQRAQLPSFDGLFTSADYPAEALRTGSEGRVQVRLAISQTGRVSDCNVIQSSGSASLDSQTCQIFMSRAFFIPASDAQGRRTTDVYTQSVRWSLPEQASTTE
jgi:TonB family protein